MKFSDLKNKTIGIWGMGVEGKSTWTCLEKHVPSAHLLEITEENKEQTLPVCDVVIKSPGISLYRPDIQTLVKQGKLTSASNLFFANRDPSVRVIAVSGTKGKSTTSSLLAHTLSYLGVPVKLGGNIGVPLLDFIDEKNITVVAELSSYQCSDLHYGPDIAVLTNLYPEHLQWHGSHQQYWSDKLNMIKRAKQAILNKTDARTKRFAVSGIFFNNPALFHVRAGWFYKGKEKLFACSQLNLTGLHNAQNACAVLTAVDLLGYDYHQCAACFHTFQPLAHRLQPIRTWHDILFIDDSISTTPETAISAMKAFQDRPITLIAGGLDRGQKWGAFSNYVTQHQVVVIALPETGYKIAQACQQKKGTVYQVKTMKEAVEIAKKITPAKGIVLLSPASPSYNMYKNYIERGKDFAQSI